MKYRKNMKSSFVKISGILACISLAACLSTVLPEQSSVKNLSPFVEAYIEYTGAPARFAGPASFILHVNAKDSKVAEVSVKHEMIAQKIQTENRALASVSAVSSAEARNSITRLGEALDGETAVTPGCISPIRVRVIREDGSLLEKSGCRSGSGWPAFASQMVNDYMTQAH